MYSEAFDISDLDSSVRTHVQDAHIKLGLELRDQKSIYLDTNFWLLLREVYLGRCLEPNARVLMQRLSNIVNAGSAFLPLSETTFVEVLKQSDPQTRRATTDLLCKLSRGVSVVYWEERIKIEITYLLARFIYNESSSLPPKGLMFTKTSFVLGILLPRNSRLSADNNTAIQIGFFDHLWTLPSEEMFAQIGKSEETPHVDLTALAMKLNELNCKHKDEIKSFRSAYKHEVAGLADLYAEGAKSILAHFYRMSTGLQPTASPEELKKHTTMLRNLIARAALKPVGRDVLRTLHVWASLAAQNRWDKTQRLQANDLHDTHHALAAVSYCDLFLTEKPLAARLRQAHLGTSSAYGCEIACSSDEALDALNRLFT